jgi:hypothetical protein
VFYVLNSNVSDKIHLKHSGCSCSHLVCSSDNSCDRPGDGDEDLELGGPK